MRKGQVEMVGLMVIVILILIISFIFIRISTMPENKDVIKENTEVTNLLNALMKMTPCESIQPRQSIAGIIVECGNGDYCGMNCKDYIKQEIEKVMIAMEKEKYEFIIKKEEEIWLKIGNCNENIFSDRYVNPNFVAQLMLC